MARKQNREALWHRRLERQAASGQSKRAWCARHGVSEKAFYYWQRRLIAADDGRDAPVFLEVAPSSLQSIGIEVILENGRRVRVERGFDRETLRQVVAALESSPC